MEDKILSIVSEVTSVTDAVPGGHISGQKEAQSEEILAAVLKSLEENKADDIVQINLRGIASFGDYMVICSGRSSRQVVALAEKLVQTVKSEFEVISRMEGKETGDWVLIDTGDVVVHVFRPEVREFYQLEKMWLQDSTP